VSLHFATPVAVSLFFVDKCAVFIELLFQMVVLEGGGMLTTGSNQYLQPDYLSPLPTTVS
jgi:hypothetical protein